MFSSSNIELRFDQNVNLSYWILTPLKKIEQQIWGPALEGNDSGQKKERKGIGDLIYLKTLKIYNGNV